MCNIRRRMTLLRNIGILVALVAIGVGSYVSWIKLFPNCHSAFYSPTKYTATKSPYLVDYDAVPTSISKGEFMSCLLFHSPSWGGGGGFETVVFPSISIGNKILFWFLPVSRLFPSSNLDANPTWNENSRS